MPSCAGRSEPGDTLRRTERARLLFLVLNLAAKEWKMPPREWCMAKAQLAILFEDRFILA